MNDMFKPDEEIINLTELREAEEDVGRNPSDNPNNGRHYQPPLSRAAASLAARSAVTAIATTVSPLALMIADEARAEGMSAFSFTEVEAGVDETHHVAEGYDADVLLRWGDKVFADSPEFDPMNQTAESQSKQFGYNNDYVGFIPLDGADDHGLLVVNHEYTNAELMFPNWATIGKDGEGKDKVMMGEFTKDIVDIEMAAHGGTVIEIRKENGKWVPVLDGTMNRRLHVGTEMALSGPAAGHDRLKTNADTSGRKVFGTLNNCAGGVTPWGTWLMAEENFHGYFVGELPEGHPETVNYERYGAPRGWYNWGTHHDRFDVSKEPNEPNRFGWVVEVDPTDPNSVPKKRTALGRMKHEGAESVLNKDGRVVFYCGDDNRFDYVYKFVSAGTVSGDKAQDMQLLSEGTLYVARYNDDGSYEWMPLVHGEGPLTAENGFNEPGRRDDRHPSARRTFWARRRWTGRKIFEPRGDGRHGLLSC